MLGQLEHFRQMMKILLTIFLFFVAFFSNAQRTMFGAQNNFVAPLFITDNGMKVIKTTNIFDANIAMILFFNRELSQAEISQIFNDNKAKYNIN